VPISPEVTRCTNAAMIKMTGNGKGMALLCKFIWGKHCIKKSKYHSSEYMPGDSTRLLPAVDFVRAL